LKPEDKNQIIENIAWHDYECCKKRMRMNFEVIEKLWNIVRIENGYLIWRDIDGVFEFNGYKDPVAPIGSWLYYGIAYGENLAKEMGYKKVRLLSEGKMNKFLKNVGYFEKEI